VALYEFWTLWRIEASPAAVFAALGEPTSWPTWWPEFVEVEQLEDGGPDGLGAVYRFVVQSFLPYRLSFRLRVTRREPPLLQEGTAVGELDGFGRLDLREDGGVTIVRYTWCVRTTKRWMNLLSAARPLFAWNHDVVMRRGAQGLGRHLGARVLGVESHTGQDTPVPAGESEA
jgi:hypothetical protein